MFIQYMKREECYTYFASFPNRVPFPQGLYYSYYYDDAMNDGGAFPMETQVLMQEVLTDGLAFCSLM